MNYLDSPIDGISEFGQQLRDVLILLEKNKVPQTSRLVGQVQLELLESGTLHTSLWQDEKCIWTPWADTDPVEPETGRTRMDFEQYPNFAAEVPLQCLHRLINCKLYWEMLTLHEHRGLFLRIVRSEFHYSWVNREYETEWGSDIGLLFWGNGQGSFDYRNVWSSDLEGLPSFIS